jgi:hypothetical protein
LYRFMNMLYRTPAAVKLDPCDLHHAGIMQKIIRGEIQLSNPQSDVLNVGVSTAWLIRMPRLNQVRSLIGIRSLFESFHSKEGWRWNRRTTFIL